MTSELAVRVGVKRYLRRLKLEGKPCEWTSIHGDSYTIGEPDIVGCLRGRMVCIELKAPGKHSTKLQTARQDAWEQAGALVLRDMTSWTQVAERFEKEGLV